MEAYRVNSVDHTEIIASIEVLKYYEKDKVLELYNPNLAEIPRALDGILQTAGSVVPATRDCQFDELVPEDMIPEAPGHAIRLAPGQRVQCPMSGIDHVHIQDVMARLDVYGCPVFHASELVEALRMY